MNFKTWVKTLIIFTGLLYLFLYIFYVLINPMQEFENSLTKNKYFYNKNYSRKQFKKLKTSKNLLLFGTSKIHVISSKMLHRNVLNFHNLYGESGDILNFLMQLDNKQISNIDEILYGIDFPSIRTRIDTELINYSDKLKLSGLDYKKLKTTFLDIKYNLQSEQIYMLNEDGSNKFFHIYNGSTINKNLTSSFFPFFPYNIITLNEIIEINKFCLKNNIKITFFTPVENDIIIMGANFDKIKKVFSLLIDGGIREIMILYYINGISNYKNGDYYPAFRDAGHINKKYLKEVLNKYILNTDHQYSISNQEELGDYVNRMKHIQINYNQELK